jgi:hypothetical protein
MPISRMQQPRQMYGLGSFVKKAVKGVTGAVKKIAGSDVGKLALTAGALYGLGGAKFLGGQGIFAGGQGLSRFSNLANLPAALGIGKSEGITSIAENFPGGGMGLATTVAGLTGFLSAQGKTEEEIAEIKQDPKVLGGYLEQYYRNLNPPTADTNSEEYEAQVSDFVQRNLKADGGRIGYQDGTPKEGIETITPMKKPDNDVQYVKDTIKSLDGFAQLIAQEGNLDRKTFQNHMDMFEDFRQRKDIDAMPAYTYLQRRVQELNPEVAKMIYITQEDNPNKTTIEKPKMAMGGRMGFEGGGYTFEDFLKDKQQVDQAMSMEELRREYERMMKLKNIRDTRDIAAYGGRMGYAFGNQPEQNAMQASGIGGLPLNQNPAGITELDLRDNGGFIPPVGVKEKADDIPAMLSNNEFVFTADAVRGMGEGDVNVGAQRMYDMMKKLENGGRV